MSTNQGIVDEAAQELGYINRGESLDNTADGEADQAMDVLNDYMEELRIRDIDLNWFVQDTLTATCPIPSWAKSGVVSNLALRLGARFDVVPSVQLTQKAYRGEKAIATVIFNQIIEGGQDMTHLNRGEGQLQSWDIEVDTI